MPDREDFTVSFRMPGKAAEAIQIDLRWDDIAVPGENYTYREQRRGRGFSFLVDATPKAARNLLRRCKDRAYGSGWAQPASCAQACKVAAERIEDAL